MQTIKNKEIFASMMHKLAETNLADTAPHPLVEFWFHDHPSIEKRIKAAQSL
jgi:STE24 endopeptidase